MNKIKSKPSKPAVYESFIEFDISKLKSSCSCKFQKLNVMCCYRLQLWIGNFICFKFTFVFSSVKAMYKTRRLRLCIKPVKAMYKTNTETGNWMRGTREIGGMLYSRESRQTFWGMLLNIRGMLPNITGDIAKHSGECRLTFAVYYK